MTIVRSMLRCVLRVPPVVFPRFPGPPVCGGGDNLYDCRVERSAAPGRDTLEGTVRLFAAESLVFPTGIVTAAFLTRWLGAEGYGEFSLAALVVGWVQWGVVSLLSRSTILSIGGTTDWKPLATRILRIHLAAGLVTGAIVFLAAPLLARALGLPSLTSYLRLFASSFPCSCMRTPRTSRPGGRSDGRRPRHALNRADGAIVLLVALGLSITGASRGRSGLGLDSSWPGALTGPPCSRSPLPPLLAAALALPLGDGVRFVQDADLFALRRESAPTGIYAAASLSSRSRFSRPPSPSSSRRSSGWSERALDHARDGARRIRRAAPDAVRSPGGGAAEDRAARLRDPFPPRASCRG
jgi:hypothetical protein